MDREPQITADSALIDDASSKGFSQGYEGRNDVPATRSPVMAWNEWDPLEEVIVGSLDGAVSSTFGAASTI